MPFIGNKPSAVPLTSADIADGIITSAKIVDATIANADIANSTINLTSKVTGTLPVANGGTGLAAIGTSLQVLRTNTGATALEYATLSTGAAAGQVIQVVNATDSTRRSTSSLSYVTASNTLSVAITPSSASNKVLILVQTTFSAINDIGLYTIFRDSTNLGTAGGLSATQTNAGIQTGAMIFLDSPSTTSAITYQVYMKADGGGGATILLQDGIATRPIGSITCMEIKG